MVVFLGIFILALTGGAWSDDCTEPESTTSDTTTISSTSTADICSGNSTFTYCAKPEASCDDFKFVVPRTVCDENGNCYVDHPFTCAPGCMCKTGYVRNYDMGGSDCILPNDCPGCGCNEKFNEICVNHPSACEPSCENPNPEPCPHTTPIRGCQCKPGYLRHKNGKCVQPSRCPGQVPTTTSICPGNETYSKCIIVEPTCDNLDPDPAVYISTCAPGCTCLDGYVRDEEGRCILRNDCPGCGCNEKFHEKCVNCPNPCAPSCDNPNPGVCRRLCLLRGCECKPGYIRLKHGKCVEPSRCPVKTTSSSTTTTETPSPTPC